MSCKPHLNSKSVLCILVCFFCVSLLHQQTPPILAKSAYNQTPSPNPNTHASNIINKPIITQQAPPEKATASMTAVCNVPSASYPTINSAVLDGTCNPITVAAGTYTENITLDRNVTINGAGKGITIIDGSNIASVFRVTFDALTINIANVTIQNGNATGTGQGGGLENWTSSGIVNVSNSEFLNNNATFGGGLMHGGGASTVINTDFIGNSATTSGGAVYNAGTLSIANSQLLTNNSANGGSMYNENSNGAGILNITTTLYQGNTASSFGGAIDNRATLSTAHTTFYNNNGTSGAGALYNGGGATANIYYTTFFSNNGAQGGAINNEDATVNLHYSTITNNRGNDGTESLGDGILNLTFADGATSTVNLNNTTVANNDEIGILQADASTNGATAIQVNLANSIVSGNPTTDCRKYLNRASEVFNSTNGYNLDTDGTCLDASTGNTTADPQLGTLQDNGGHTWTMAPAPTSPILNTIPANANGCGATYQADQHGIQLPQNNLCDMGAYEQEASNTAPVAVDDSYMGVINQPVTIAPAGVLGNDSDADNDAIIVTANTNSVNGGLAEMHVDGGFVFTPSLDYEGLDSFTYTIMDTAGLVSYWPFEETAVDITTNSNNAMLMNGLTYDTDTPTLNIINQHSLNFDGTDDFATITDDNTLDLTTFSIGGWVKPRSTDTNWQPLFTKEAENGGERSFGLFIAPNTLQLHASFFSACTSGTNQFLNSVNELTLNSWHHVMITYDGYMFALYIDGMLQNSIFAGSSICQNNHPIRLGGGESVFSKFDGHMDEVRIYNQAFSATEVLQTANGNNSATDTGQVTIDLKPVCFAETTGDNVTDFASGDSSAVQQAIDSVASGLIRLSGTCTGVQTRGSFTQTAYLIKDIHIQGGYDHTNWDLPPDPIANPTVLDADGLGRVAYIVTGFDVTLENLILQNGVANGIDGAGIYNRGNLTLQNSIVQNNRQTGAFGGGGLFSWSPNTSIISSTIRHNSTDGSGGGLFLYTGLTLVDNTHIFSNTAVYGGGVNSQLQTLFLVDSMVEENQASLIGGGVSTIRGSLQFAYSTLLNNQSNQGAAINNQEGNVSIQNSTITQNRGAQSLYNLRTDVTYLATMSLANTTVVSNTGTGIVNNDNVTTVQSMRPTDKTPLTSPIMPSQMAMAPNSVTGIINPIGHWPFDDGANPTADTSTNNNDGTLTNSPTFSTDVPAALGTGQSLHFPNASDYVNVPDASVLRISDQFTIAFWMKADNMSQSQTYLVHRSSNQVAVIYEYVDNNVELFSGTASGDDPRVGSQMAIPDTGWHHVVYTYDGITLRGYIDGVEQISVAKSFVLSTNAGDWNFGSVVGAVGNFDGKLDDIYLYDQGLSEANVQAIMNGSSALDPNDVKVTLASSLIAHNSVDCVNIRGLIDATNGYNLDMDSSCVASGGVGNITADPLLSSLQFDITLNQAYYTPNPYSPLIDAIPANVNNCGAGFFGEQLNRTRPIDAQCDIGSIELQVNYAPTAIADTYTSTQNIPLTIPASGLLGNDLDGDWDGLTAVLHTPPSNGTASIASDGSFVYTPTTNYIGTDTFTYKTNDGTVESAPTVVTIQVVAAAVSPALNITLNGADHILNWNTLLVNCHHSVYRSNAPYTGYSPLVSNTANPPYTDPNTVGNPAIHHFYYIEAINCPATSTASSNTVGSFTYAIVAGD